jgi:hypothetical protein
MKKPKQTKRQIPRDRQKAIDGLRADLADLAKMKGLKKAGNKITPVRTK